MDSKETWLVKETVGAITGGNFHERDVLALLILLREYAPQKTPVREFGDFVAHRERDRGVLLDVRERIRLALLNQSNKTENLPIWSVDEIRASLNDTLALFGATPVDLENANQVTVSVMTLLQGVRLGIGKGQFDHLGIEMSSHHVLLQAYGAVPAGHIFSFPLLIAENNGYEFSLRQQLVEYPLRCDRVVESFAIGGKFQIEGRAPAV